MHVLPQLMLAGYAGRMPLNPLSCCGQMPENVSYPDREC